jgi:putative endonuclease
MLIKLATYLQIVKFKLITLVDNFFNMKKYVFIVTDRNRSSLHVGMSADLTRTIHFYRQMPNLLFDSSQQLTRLVYFEELSSEEAAMQRLRLISRFTRIQKERLIRSVNPDWLDLSASLAAERIMAVNYNRIPVRTLF